MRSKGYKKVRSLSSSISESLSFVLSFSGNCDNRFTCTKKSVNFVVKFFSLCRSHLTAIKHL